MFVSVGGGDAEELDYLLRNSDAGRGNPHRIQPDPCGHRRKRQDSLPHPKRLVVLEGDARDHRRSHSIILPRGNGSPRRFRS